MKKFITVLILIFLFAFPVAADDLYESTLEASGFKEVYNNTPEAVTDFLEKKGIDAFSPDFVADLSAENLFSVILSFLREGTDDLGGALTANIAILLLWAIYTCFAEKDAANDGVNTAFTIILSLSLTVPIIKLITATGAAIKSGGVFMLSFLPVFFGVTAASGAVQTVSSNSLTLLLACEITVQIIAFAVVPIACAELALAISGVFSDISPAFKLSSTLRRASTYVLTLTFTIFLGLLSVQTAISSAADSVSLKTAKFVVGSFVPVAGTALSETISTLGSSIKILQNGVGVYGIVAVLLTVLPTAAALLLWRLTLFAAKTTAEMLGLEKAVRLSSAVDGTLSMLLGVLLFVSALFIISLAILLKVGGV